MKLFRLLLALPVLALVVSVAYVAQATESAGSRMADAADNTRASCDGYASREPSGCCDDRLNGRRALRRNFRPAWSPQLGSFPLALHCRRALDPNRPSSDG